MTGTARDMRVSLAGWNTVTTRSRLSALISALADDLAKRRPSLSVADAVADASGPRLYPHGLGVSTCKGQARIHDARGITNINDNDWHSVQLEG